MPILLLQYIVMGHLVVYGDDIYSDICMDSQRNHNINTKQFYLNMLYRPTVWMTQYNPLASHRFCEWTFGILTKATPY